MNETVPRIPEALELPTARLRARREHLLRELERTAERPRRRGRGTLVAALAGVLIVAGGAGAATGVLPVGTELPLPGASGDGEPRYRSHRVVVATGTAAESGRWEMTFVESDAGPCVGLRLLDRVPPGAARPDLHEGCGDSGTLTAGRVGGGDWGGRPEFLVHGRAPEDAEHVRLVAADGVVVTTSTHEGPSDVPGDFYLVATPPGLRDAHVSWIDRNGTLHGPGAPVPGTIDYSGRPETPSRPR